MYYLFFFVEKGLNVSFSKVKYRDIAPRVGLDPTSGGRDMKTFEIHRARIPTSMFKEIVGDLDMAMYQYGEPLDHDNEEARSRCLAPVSAQIYRILFHDLFLLVALIPAVQPDGCPFQINHPQYSRIYHTRPHDNEGPR